MRKISILLEFEDEHKSDEFEVWLKNYIDFKTTVLPDTTALYESDPQFRKICKEVKLAKKGQSDYIYKNNNK